ncbi:MAG: BatA domain-containing protein [Planctomycetes bacterium]|nr:BatA domain-containing protein [Planctomycetota bacterium]
MQFLNPALFALSALAGVIILLYILKVKRKEIIVPSTSLWNSLIRDVQASKPFQKLKINLLLILQLLALFAIVTALADPVKQSFDLESKTVILVLDNSASMRSENQDGVSRFELAKQKCIEVANIADTVKEKEKPSFMLIATSPAPVALSSFTRDTGVIRERISALALTDTDADIKQLNQLLLSASKGKENVRTMFFTDGCWKKDGTLIDNKNVEFVQVGDSNYNAGITSFSVFSPTADELEQLGLSELEKKQYPFKIYVKAGNFSSSLINTTASLYQGDNLIAVKEVSIQPGSFEKIIFNEKLTPGLAKVQLDLVDKLKTDNQCWAMIPELKPFRVLIIGKDDPYLLRCFDSIPFSELSSAASEPVDLKPEYDLIIFNGVATKGSYAANTLKIGSAIADGEEIEFPDVIEVVREHPVMAGVKLMDVAIGKSLVLKDEQLFTNLVSGTDNIPLVRINDSELVEMQIAFDLDQSDLPLRPSFIILISNLVEYLRLRLYRPFVQTGKSFPTAGYFDDQSGPLCVNMLSEIESDIEIIKLRDAEFGIAGKIMSSQVVVSKPLYWVFCLAMLLLLLFEWFAFHRRLGV